MPAPSRYTPRQAKLWEKIVRRLKNNSDVKNPFAVATAAVDKRIESRKTDGAS